MNEETQKLIQEGREAVGLADSVDSYKALMRFREMFAKSQQSAISLSDDLKKLMFQLKIVAFANLLDEETFEVLSKYYLELCSMGVPIEERLALKLFSVPYLVRDELRKKLKKALLQNNQLIGRLTIGQWVEEFEKMSSQKGSEISIITRFVVDHVEAKMLPPSDKKMLKELLHTYDYCLASTLPTTGRGLINLLNSEAVKNINSVRGDKYPMPKSIPQISGHVDRPRQFSEYDEKKILPVDVPLGKALIDYPNLGEQTITSAPLKLRIFPEPARPSIKNWIADYHDALGRGKHGMMERGNFLFHGENTKRLNSLERRRLAEVLKSLDDDSVLSINPQSQKIVFETNSQDDFRPVAEKPAVSSERPTETWQPKMTRPTQQPSVAPKPFVANVQERYEIPKKAQNVPARIAAPARQLDGSHGGGRSVAGGERGAWNPAENVKKRMAEEDKNFGSSRIRYQENKAPQESTGSLRFSSPQRLPVERKQEAPRSFPSAVSYREQTDEDLMEKMRELKKQSNQQSKSRVVYKITPIGFVEKKEEKMEYQSDDQGPKVRGNVVDLSQ